MSIGFDNLCAILFNFTRISGARRVAGYDQRPCFIPVTRVVQFQYFCEIGLLARINALIRGSGEGDGWVGGMGGRRRVGGEKPRVRVLPFCKNPK
jgi:hypothetical protein